MSNKIWAGLDVGSKSISVCVIDDRGTILHEGTCPNDLADLHDAIRWLRRRRHARIGLEAANGFNLARGLQSLGYSIDLYETRQLSKFLRVRRNKTDAGDAIGIAEAGRIGASTLSKVHLKSLECQFIQSLLTIRRQLIRQRVSTLNLLGRQIASYGGRLTRSGSPAKTRQNAELELDRLFRRWRGEKLACEFHWLLKHYSYLVDHQTDLDRELQTLAQNNEVCRRFMEIPGIGPLSALSFFATVAEPTRFRRSTDVGAYLGLSPKIHQSGLTCRRGRISKMGNCATRAYLVQSAMTFMRHAKPDLELSVWVSKVEERRGRNKARVALARKLAVTMLSMWKSGAGFHAEPGPSSATASAETHAEILNLCDTSECIYEADAGSRCDKVLVAQHAET